jgi:peptidoglycan/LPS O-acetylase OafA/YrhL
MANVCRELLTVADRIVSMRAADYTAKGLASAGIDDVDPKSPTLGKTAPLARSNNFDALRFWAAIAVLWSHAFPLSGTTTREPITVITNNQESAGSIAVVVFFVMSGYLIALSYDRGRNPLIFVRSRALRILPGLIVLLSLLSLVVGPLLTVNSIKDYFLDFRPFKYIVLNLPVFLSARDELPGLFLNNPFPRAVDGSLWTLAYEVRCYAVILILGLAGLLNKWAVLSLYILSVVAAACLSSSDHHFLWQNLRFATPFLAGSCLYLWKLETSPVLVCAAILILAGAAIVPGFLWLALASAGAYLVIGLAKSETIKVPHLARYGDLSYGIYIYAFPVQQVAAMFLDAGWLVNAIVCTPIVIGMSALSWRFVEEPALRLKSPRPVWKRSA